MQHKKKREFHDLLIPVIIILSVLPFITRLFLYDSGLSVYPWFSDQGAVSDFFSYYKSYSFIILSFLSGIVLLIYLLLNKDSIKGMGPFLFLGIYSIMVFLSTFFSVSPKMSLSGGIAHFESLFVLLGYVIIILYSYQTGKSEDDYKLIVKCIVTALAIMCFLGLFQMFGKDLLQLPWFQKLIIPSQYHSIYVGKITNLLSTNAVALTLFNPNYACIYLSMFFSFFSVFLLSEQDKKKKAAYLLLICLLLLLIFKTYSRVGLIAVFFHILLLGYFYRRQLKKLWLPGILFVFAGAILFVGMDAMNGFRYVTKLKDTLHSFQSNPDRNTLNDILTTQDDILIRYQEKELHVSFADPSGDLSSLTFSGANGEDLTQYYQPDQKVLNLEPFDKFLCYTEESDQQTYILCRINDILWQFAYDTESGYQYINDFGKTDRLTKIDKFGFANAEHIASGRGYIWSRSLPLLKSALLIGTGPDTFPIVFPQSDYVGKANNCKTPYTLIEKPHNFYLMTGIQTGMVSLIALLCFYGLYLVRSFRIYRVRRIVSFTEQFGLGCLLATITFLITGFFNDSSIQTTPIFCVLLGLGMDINHRLQKEKLQP